MPPICHGALHFKILQYLGNSFQQQKQLGMNEPIENGIESRFSDLGQDFKWVWLEDL